MAAFELLRRSACCSSSRSDAILSKHQFPTLADETTDANRAIRLSYGLGFGLYWTPYGKAFFKEGHDDGFRHYAVCFDTAKTGLIIMTNSSNGEGISRSFSRPRSRIRSHPSSGKGSLPTRRPASGTRVW